VLPNIFPVELFPFEWGRGGGESDGSRVIKRIKHILKIKLSKHYYVNLQSKESLMEHTISGFRRDVDENCLFLEYDVA
jgi:hypothetical protein